MNKYKSKQETPTQNCYNILSFHIIYKKTSIIKFINNNIIKRSLRYDKTNQKKRQQNTHISIIISYNRIQNKPLDK